MGYNEFNDSYSIRFPYVPDSANPCDRCYDVVTTYNNLYYNARIPIRLSYHKPVFSADMTFSSAAIFKKYRETPSLGFWNIQTSFSWDMIELIKADSKFEFNLSLTHSYVKLLNSDKSATTALGPSISLGIRNLKLRGTLGTSFVGDYYSSFDLMYYIYPFRKREKKEK